MAVEGIPQRDVVVTFTKPWASYKSGEDAAFTADEAAELVELGVAGTLDSPPQNFTVPAVYQDGNALHCTMGEWTGSPTSYSYLWTLDGADAGADADMLPVTPADAGKPASCVLTATNDFGSTTAPPSNEIIVA